MNMNSYLVNTNPFFEQQKQTQKDIEDSHSLLEGQHSANNLNYLNGRWLHNIHVHPNDTLPEHSTDSDLNMFIPNSLPALVHDVTPNYPHQDYMQGTPQLNSQLTSQHIEPVTINDYNLNEQPICIRKKPGRKPNPAPPAVKKAQNRAAQRAFRERKESHLRDLENTIRTLREQKNASIREAKKLKENLEFYKVETWYLKGVVLTLQFICMHHNIQIPTHSPYLSEETLKEIAQSAPHAIEAYVNTYTHNNENLKNTKYYHHLNEASYHQIKKRTDKLSARSEGVKLETVDPGQIDLEPPSPENSLDLQVNNNIQLEENQHPPQVSNIDIINNIRQKLSVKASFDMDDESNFRLRPSLLQLVIPHDPRIDLVPTPHTRDRMIIFRDQMDYDRCFSILSNDAVYHGGDPTKAESWELPAEFFNEFWYLTINYDINQTNKWRRLKGLQDIPPGTISNQYNSNTINPWPLTTNGSVSDNMYGGIVENMPTLQSISQIGYPSPLSGTLYRRSMSTICINENSKTVHQNTTCAPEMRRSMNVPDFEIIQNSL